MENRVDISFITTFRIEVGNQSHQSLFFFPAMASDNHLFPLMGHIFVIMVNFVITTHHHMYFNKKISRWNKSTGMGWKL